MRSGSITAITYPVATTTAPPTTTTTTTTTTATGVPKEPVTLTPGIAHFIGYSFAKWLEAKRPADAEGPVVVSVGRWVGSLHSVRVWCEGRQANMPRLTQSILVAMHMKPHSTNGL